MLLLGRRCWPASTAASWRTVHSASFRGIAPRRNPSFHDLAGDLKGLPAFKTRGEDVRVIYEPVEFYQTLLVSISNKSISLEVGLTEVERAASDLDGEAENLYRVFVYWQGGDRTCKFFVVYTALQLGNMLMILCYSRLKLCGQPLAKIQH